MTVRVIQWATGSVGAAQLREVIDRPDLEFVGLYVYSPSKVGVDAGALVGRPPTGVLATNDAAAILELDADVVLHAASKAFRDNINTDDIVALLASGKNVITTTSYNHLPTFGPEADDRINRACAQAGTRFHAAGEHPGFMFERLATSLTALSQRVDKITVQEFVDCRAVTAREMLVDLMGMGNRLKRSRSSPRCSALFPLSTSSRWRRRPMCWGCESTRSGERSRRRRVPHDFEVACGTLPAGSVVGQILSWTAHRDGVPVLVAEEYWTVDRRHSRVGCGPRRPVPRAGHRRRIAAAACRAHDR